MHLLRIFLAIGLFSTFLLISNGASLLHRRPGSWITQESDDFDMKLKFEFDDSSASSEESDETKLKSKFYKGHSDEDHRSKDDNNQQIIEASKSNENPKESNSHSIEQNDSDEDYGRSDAARFDKDDHRMLLQTSDER
ncbi:unnamed protein product [Rotaria magnacalcarata]|uniref:Uncharacterized protein n=1 Tax=Rotaria magnacalcarata TaxID=392030 RepID=A0A818ZTC8_9BILA|nr:unnamed protein product [Rotaria magnacalcarata]CAF3773431.1 unnamed protein product [Rotaria magnacalcarata]